MKSMMSSHSSVRFAFTLALTAALVGCTGEVDGNPDADMSEDAGLAQDAGHSRDAGLLRDAGGEPDAGMEPDAGESCAEGETRACALTETCSGTQTCEGGAYGTCVAPLELCNGTDDDCDSAIDEGYAGLGDRCTLGVGACVGEGVQVCDAEGEGLVCDATPGSPAAEVCDGVDDDCDDAVDEDAAGVGDGCTRGVGACERTGVQMCGAEGLVCDATPGSPPAEVCDGADNDCDSRIDEDAAGVGAGCTRGVGACARTGVRVCSSGSLVCDATPGSPTAEVCDGADNDCDSRVDETGTPAFTAAGYTASRSCVDLAVGDINGDAHPDIVCAMEIDTTLDPDTRLAYFRSTGPATFGTVQYTSPVGVSPFRVQSDIALGDLNGDGRDDLVAVGETMKAQVYRNTGSAFAAPVEAFNFSVSGEPGTGGLLLYDFNGDGRLDILTTIGTIRSETSWRLVVSLGNGNGTFQAPTELGVTNNGRAKDILVGDVDADGDQDLLVLTNERVIVYRRAGSTFGAPAILISGLDAVEELGYADVTGDGRPDLLIPQSGNVQLHRAQGLGFAAPVTATLPGTAFAAAFMQFDCDATAEAVVAMVNGGARPRLYANPATMADWIELPAPTTGLMTVEVADLNGDGFDDLVIGRTTNGISVLRRLP